MRRPPHLVPGDTLYVTAPSSPFENERFQRGLALLGARYRVRLDPALYERRGFLAGGDADRRAGLMRALGDANAKAIVPPRGGYGITRLLPQLDLDEIVRANKWLVGFSDATALHAQWARAGLCSIHGPMVCSFAEGSDAVQSRWFDLLEGRHVEPLTGLTCVREGSARGALSGGNLTMLTALVGTPYMPNLDGTLLLLEDVTERPYRIDRMLTTLLQSGALSGVRGVLLGQFTQCEPGPDGVTVHEVLEERLGTLGVPIVANAPIGHVDENVPVLLGGDVELDAGAGVLRFG